MAQHDKPLLSHQRHAVISSFATRADTAVTVGRDMSRRSGGLRSEGLTRGELVGPEAKEKRDTCLQDGGESSTGQAKLAAGR